MTVHANAVQAALYTPEEAAAALTIKRSTLFQLLATGRLRSVKIGKLRRIPAGAIAEFVQQLETEQTQG